ncbi:ABC transporter transmembrane domain-containing protein [Jannaschia marina]|uniref:ABC transporter transmembrane domain-containing protein n=1 Tax=Jannaschia marina TaxID=2741674 RepID=UPI0015CBEBBA|nr:ABC transporter ATP-binding protein [Jannaschia marina]
MSRRPPLLGARRWVALAILVALALGQAMTMIVTAFATRDIFMYLRDGGAAPPNGALFAIATAGLALCLLRALEGRVGEGAGQSYAAAIRRTLFRHVTRMPSRAIAERRSGALALRYVGDLAAFKGWIARGLARLISAAITIPAALLILYILEPALLWAALGPLSAVLLCIWLLGRPLGAAHATLRSRRAGLAAAMAERLPQGIALRRAGRMRTELKALTARSRAVAEAGVHREWLAATVRALPDAGAGLAGALCLWACLRLGLGVPEAVAALTALAMVVWPLRHLADVADRRRAYVVARDKLDRMLATDRLPTPSKSAGETEAPAIRIAQAETPGGAPLTLTLGRGEMRRLAGPSGAGKTTLLLALAGHDRVPAAEQFEVCGVAPGALTTGRVLYLGRQAPTLRGSLRREVTIGLGRSPDDDEIANALDAAGLSELRVRLDGPDGQIAEGRRNLTATEQAGLHIARALLARPDLALIDADELGLGHGGLARLVAHLAKVGSAALIVTSEPAAILRLGEPVRLSPGTSTPPTEVDRPKPVAGRVA